MMSYDDTGVGAPLGPPGLKRKKVGDGDDMFQTMAQALLRGAQPRAGMSPEKAFPLNPIQQQPMMQPRGRRR